MTKKKQPKQKKTTQSPQEQEKQEFEAVTILLMNFDQKLSQLVEDVHALVKNDNSTIVLSAIYDATEAVLETAGYLSLARNDIQWIKEAIAQEETTNQRKDVRKQEVRSEGTERKPTLDQPHCRQNTKGPTRDASPSGRSSGPLSKLKSIFFA